MKKVLKISAITLIAILSLALVLYVSLVIVFNAELNREFKAQAQYIETLRKNPGQALDESSFVDFDLENNTLHLNEIQFLATHNSFKKLPSKFVNKPLELFSSKVKNGYYGYDSLTEQLNKGMRGLELDVTMYDGKFVLSHNAYTDWRTNGVDFSLALEEIKIWSDLNAGHIPLNLMIQVRDSWSPYNHKYGKYSFEDFVRLDKLLSTTFGEDGIIKPGDIIGESGTVRQGVEDGNWPLLSECRGKVFFAILFDKEKNVQNYIDIDPTFKTQRAFIMTSGNKLKDYSAIVHADDARKDTQMLENLVSKNYILRSRIDEQFDYSADRRSASIDVGAVILATDHMEGSVLAKDYVCRLNGEKTVIARGSLQQA